MKIYETSNFLKKNITKAALVSFFSYGAGLAVPFGMQVLLDNLVILDPSLHGLVLTFIVSAVILEIVLSYDRQQRFDEIGDSIDENISQNTIDSLLNMDNSFVQNAGPGQVVHRFSQPDRLRRMLAGQFPNVVCDCLFSIFLILCISYYSLLIGLTAFFLIMINIAVNLHLNVELSQVISSLIKEERHRSHLLSESVESLGVIQAFGLQDSRKKDFSESLSSIQKRRTEMLRIINKMEAASKITQRVIVLVLAFIAGIEISKNTLSLGGLFACQLFVNRALSPLGQVSFWAREIGGLKQEMKSLRDFIDKGQEINLQLPVLEEIKFLESISFENVNIGPESISWSARIDNFSISSRGVYVVTGLSGSGKSTFLRVLAGLQEKKTGTIFYNNQPSEAFSKESIRSLSAFSFQDNILFTGTLLENIILGLPLDVKKLNHVLVWKNLKAILSEKEWELNMKITPGGSNLSGEQRRRIALARALYRSVDLYIFDEPTNDLDETSCDAFIDCLKTLSNKSIIIVSSHDPKISNIADYHILADRNFIRFIDNI